jgi:hypothetical protein
MMAVLMVGSLWAGAARADIPPSRGYVEGCTVEKQCKKEEDGDACRAWHGDRDACKKKHEKDGFAYRCKASGASVWTEVWCRPKAKAAAK